MVSQNTELLSVYLHLGICGNSRGHGRAANAFILCVCVCVTQQAYNINSRFSIFSSNRFPPT